ncbi:BA71V-A240L [African swine fever virus]|uniref:Thymidylate kinase n=1 Tax=African swine fever virus TaxID=10497 RepID=A0A894ZZF5_ASF|nr:BA71V-A240L [African swine fever virus]QXP49828.1 BA71V-A240L [African swine fever virus]
MRGILIAIEGINGVEKSTQAIRLKNALENKKYDVIYLHFPSPNTDTGKLILDVLNKIVKIPSEQLHELFTKHRCEFTAEIAALLKLNFIVIVDRYIWSGLAYAQADRIMIDTKNTFNPDYTFFLSSNKPLNEKPLHLQRLYETEEKQEIIFTQFINIINEVPKNKFCAILANLNKEIIDKIIFSKTIKVFEKNLNLDYIKMYDGMYFNVHDLDLIHFDWQKCIEEDDGIDEEYGL